MKTFDVIVVGARPAGASTAMLLARRGYHVLLLDRAELPGDCVTTNLIHSVGMAALQRWGLADAVVASGCPPIARYVMDFGPLVIGGNPRSVDGVPAAHAPRRAVLDALLLEAATTAGAELRTGFAVEQLLFEGGAIGGVVGRERGGSRRTERARVVIGTDGPSSLVARQVGTTVRTDVAPQEALYYAYWSGLPVNGEFRLYQRGDRGLTTIPTNDGLTAVIVAWPAEEFEANRRDLLGNYLAAFAAEPALAERLAGARRESRVMGRLQRNFYRQSFGPGWALVGDAGYDRDAVTAQGISDAFRAAELVAAALDESLGGRRPLLEALAEYQAARDEETQPTFELTCQLASFEPPSAETERLFGALADDQAAVDDFMSVLAGSLPVADLMARLADPAPA